MNPFKYKEATLSSGFYFDWKKKVIVYLDVDVQDVEFGSKTTYSRLSKDNPSGSFEFLMRMKNSTNINDLYDLDILEDEEMNDSLKEDFKWICEIEEVKECFIDFLKKNELYNLLHMFNEFIKPKEEVKPEVENISIFFSSYKRNT